MTVLAVFSVPDLYIVFGPYDRGAVVPSGRPRPDRSSCKEARESCALDRPEGPLDRIPVGALDP
jgi:hypothetical protein